MNKLPRAFEVINDRGLGYVYKKSLTKIMGSQINNMAYVNQLFTDKSGLEVGGPSAVFRDDGFIPIYKVVKEVDGCNFSNNTIWEGNIKSGETYNYYKEKKGTQYISEATDLSLIPSSKYEFVISSNCLEHIANPLKAVEEWIRVLKKDGLLLLVLPNKKYCFDHNRSVVEFSHLLKDYQDNTAESDLTHLDEILKLHDLKRDKPAGTFEQFRERSLNNFENRALHQHVFDVTVLKEIFNYFDLEVLITEEGLEHNILGRKKVD